MPEGLAALKENFLDKLRAVFTMKQVSPSPELILNLDQKSRRVALVARDSTTYQASST